MYSFDTNMNMVADAFEVSNLISPKPGVVWQEADEIYGSCVRTIKEVMEKSQIAPSDVCSIGIDSQSAGIMGVSADGGLPHITIHGLICAAENICMKCRSGRASGSLKICGGPASYTHGPKILWWKNEQPEAYAKTAKFVLPSGYVGENMWSEEKRQPFTHTCIHFSNFGDNLKKEWSEELLDLFGVAKEKMARIASSFEIAGTTTAEFAKTERPGRRNSSCSRCWRYCCGGLLALES